MFPPDASDAPALLLVKARYFQALSEEKSAVISRIKAYIRPWLSDKRMRTSGEILLREIERIEAEEVTARRAP